MTASATGSDASDQAGPNSTDQHDPGAVAAPQVPGAPGGPQVPGTTATSRPGRLRALWSGIVAVFGALLGLAPHVLHHVGLLAGTALIAGTGGTALFGVIGLVASIPFLLMLKRRFRTWLAPAIGLAVFTAMFSLSAFVIGPAISGVGNGGNGPAPGPTPSQTVDEHSDHH